MRNRVRFASVILAVGLIACGAARVSCDEKVDAAGDAKDRNILAATSASLRGLMSEKIDIPPEFKGIKIPMKTALKYLIDAATQVQKQEVRFVFDKAAFTQANMQVADLYDQDIDVPLFVNKLTYRQYLEASLSQLPGDATYLVRDGLIVVLTREAARIDRLLDQKIVAEFHDKSLTAALRELSDLSGVSIAVDPRCDPDQKKTVDLRFSGDTSLRGILDSLAELHGLKVLVSPDRVAVLPQSAHLQRLRERVEEAKLLREIEGPGETLLPAAPPIPKVEK
jgi:hypothetical protein